MVSAGTLGGMGLFVKTRSKECTQGRETEERQTSPLYREGQGPKEPQRSVSSGDAQGQE